MPQATRIIRFDDDLLAAHAAAPNGAGVGSAFGLLYYALYAVLLAPMCPRIARSRACAWFYIKDLSLIPNALEFERDHAAHAYQEKRD